MANTQELERYLTATELASTLGVSRSNIFKLAKRGLLPRGLKLGHSRRWSVSDVQQALSAMTDTGADTEKEIA